MTFCVMFVSPVKYIYSCRFIVAPAPSPDAPAPTPDAPAPTPDAPAPAPTPDDAAPTPTDGQSFVFSHGVSSWSTVQGSVSKVYGMLESRCRAYAFLPFNTALDDQAPCAPAPAASPVSSPRMDRRAVWKSVGNAVVPPALKPARPRTAVCPP